MLLAGSIERTALEISSTSDILVFFSAVKFIYSIFIIAETVHVTF